VSPAALALALASACVHAAWNLLIARTPDPRAATAAAAGISVLAMVPFALATWRVEPEAWPVAAASVAFQVAYFILLGAAYRRAELSVVYPLARGSGPVLTLAVAVLVLDAPTEATQVAGVLAVGAGIVLVRGGAVGRGAGFGLAIGGTLAGANILDNEGVEHANPLAYQLVASGTAALGYAAAFTLRRGRGALIGAVTPGVALAGIGMFASYALALLAFTRASAASVAAVRETSVVIATALAASVLGERVGPARLGGAVVVAAGVALIGL
jgi:drug/metabolite transporter (DMT)-like permease